MCHRRCLSNVVLPPVSESPTLSLNADLWPLPRPTKWSYLKEDLQTAYLPVFVSSYFTLGFESHCPKLLKDYSKKTANFTPSFLRSHSRHDRSSQYCSLLPVALLELTACYHVAGICTLTVVSYLLYLPVVMLSVGTQHPFLPPPMFSSSSILRTLEAQPVLPCS